MKPTLICFDLDGVLVETRRLHRFAFRTAVREVAPGKYNFNDKDVEGLPTRRKLEKIGVDEHDFERIARRKQVLTQELFCTMLKPTPHIAAVVSDLWTRHHLACYTNSIRSSAEEVLWRIGVRRYIDYLVSNEDVRKPKPNPEGYQRLMPDLIVEDSDVGYAAAVAAVGPQRVMRVSSPDDVTVEAVERALADSYGEATEATALYQRQIDAAEGRK